MISQLKSKLYLMLRDCPLSRNTILRKEMAKGLREEMYGRGLLCDNIEIALDTFLTAEERKDTKLCESLRLDILYCYRKYGATPREYFGFDMRNSSARKRAKFLTNRYKSETNISIIGFETSRKEFSDKIYFAEKFKDFFHRDFCYIGAQDDKNSFLSFIKKHPKFIAKPNNGQCGEGIKIFDATKETNPENLFLHLLTFGGVILEELIVQTPEMAEWNPSSVNTIRVPSFLTQNGFTVFRPFLRTGRKGFVVDNGGSGGIFAMIDESTGIVRSVGANEFNGRYPEHPDSGKQFAGFQIPQWNDLISLTEKCHRTIPQYPYVGWDFALTSKGWVLIEGNIGQFLSEFVDREGIKDTFTRLIQGRPAVIKSR